MTSAQVLIPEFGQYALILALGLALIQAVFPLIGASRSYQPWIALAKPAAVGQAFFILFSFAVLTYAFISNDFSVAYVAQNSNTQLPLGYRIAAVWGAHEGSMLLWVTVLSLWMVAVAFFSKRLSDAFIARVLAILAIISIGFLLFILLTSDPFQRLLPNIPINGRDLNPLLQDPGLASHPPMLYMGYVGFSVAFAFAIAALLSGQLDNAWAKWTRPWTIAAWCFLTAGITLGSWWAYRVLGWGGWWFWDPVENASFLPWLTGTALMHSLIVTEKRSAFKSWTVLMAICAFSLSLIGTFLVRSGILVSVHAFAVDPTRGAYILKFLLFIIGGSLLLYAWRAQSVRGLGKFELLSRETLLLSNNVLLMAAMATILLGTLYPLILQSLNLGKISVGPPYFNAVFIPLLTPLLFLMGLGPQCRWKQMPIPLLLSKIKYTFAVCLLLAITLPWIITGKVPGYVLLGLLLAFWVIVTTIQTLYERIRNAGGWMTGAKKLPRSQYGMVIAHLGMAICVIGVTLTTAYSVERDLRMVPGDKVNIGAYTFTFADASALQGPNYKGVQATFDISKNQYSITSLYPQKRIYTVQDFPMSKAAIYHEIFRDLYVALGEPLGNNAWAVRIYDKPFVRWIWVGGLLMALGGLLAALDRRYRH